MQFSQKTVITAPALIGPDSDSFSTASTLSVPDLVLNAHVIINIHRHLAWCVLIVGKIRDPFAAWLACRLTTRGQATS